jgi:hypothetical protein
VGADNGRLYKFTGVFRGSPALAGAPWPVTVNAGTLLTAPVLDQFTGNLFVGDSQGILYSVNAATATVNKKLGVGKGNRNPAIIDGPIVDASNGTVFAVSSSDGNNAVLVQADATTINLYDGAFSNNYFNSPASGFMLVCGTGAKDNTPWRYTFGFTGTTLNQTPTSSAQILNSTSSRFSHFRVLQFQYRGRNRFLLLGHDRGL